MSEISVNNATLPTQSRRQAAVVDLPVLGSSRPDEAVEHVAVEPAKVEPPSVDTVKAAVAQINDYVQSVQRDLQFSVDNDLGETVVKVIDRNTGDLIRQIPNQTALELARSLKEKMDIQLIEASG